MNDGQYLYLRHLYLRRFYPVRHNVGRLWNNQLAGLFDPAAAPNFRMIGQMRHAVVDMADGLNGRRGIFRKEILKYGIQVSLSGTRPDYLYRARILSICCLTSP